MGKVVKVNLEENNKDQEEPKMDETNQNNTNAQDAIQGVQIQLVPPKDQKKKGLLDYIWRDRGPVGKAVTLTVGTAGLCGLGLGLKVLVGLLFGPEAAEMIDPSMIAPTEE